MSGMSMMVKGQEDNEDKHPKRWHQALAIYFFFTFFTDYLTFSFRIYSTAVMTVTTLTIITTTTTLLQADNEHQWQQRISRTMMAGELCNTKAGNWIIMCFLITCVFKFCLHSNYIVDFLDLVCNIFLECGNFLATWTYGSFAVFVVPRKERYESKEMNQVQVWTWTGPDPDPLSQVHRGSGSGPDTGELDLGGSGSGPAK